MTVTLLPATGVIHDEAVRQNFEFIENSFAVRPALVTALPSSAQDGQEVYFVADSARGVVWHLRYRSASSSAYKWEFVGGSSLVSGPQGLITTGSTAAVALTGGPSITVPLAGDYEGEWGGFGQMAVNNVSFQYFIVGKNGVSTGASAIATGTAMYGGGNTMAGGVFTGWSVGDVISMLVATSSGNSVTFQSGWIRIKPRRVG